MVSSAFCGAFRKISPVAGSSVGRRLLQAPGGFSVRSASRGRANTLAMPFLAVTLAFGGLFAPSLSAPALAQAVQGQGAPAVPAAVLAGLLTGQPDAQFALRQYLAQVGGDPEAVTERALAVLEQVRGSGLTADPNLILAAAQRVADVMRSTLTGTRVMQIRIDPDFMPPPGTLALDFGPADSDAPAGFEHVRPGDPRLRGPVQGIRRPESDDPLLTDGIANIEGFEMNLPDGEYNITLLTEPLSDAALTLSPFGAGIGVNGQDFDILQSTPEHWLEQAVLTGRGEQGLAAANPRVGGSVTLQVRVVGGRLVLNFNQGAGAGALRTFITGMIIQPAGEENVVWMPPEVQTFTPPETLLAQEARLANSVSEIVASAAPAAGPPQPAVPSVVPASPS